VSKLGKYLFWDIGEDEDDRLRARVDEEVGMALQEYFEDVQTSLHYRVGGAPILTLSIADEDGLAWQADLGDFLLSQLRKHQDDDAVEMSNLMALLLGAYERWRLERTATDKRSRIPEPAIDEDGEPIEREPLTDDYA
jgi:hypothetical protein